MATSILFSSQYTNSLLLSMVLAATPVVPLRLSSNYLACWSTELGQWCWPYATLAPSSNRYSLGRAAMAGHYRPSSSYSGDGVHRFFQDPPDYHMIQHTRSSCSNNNMVIIINTALFEEQLSSHRLEQTTTKSSLWFVCSSSRLPPCACWPTRTGSACQLGGTKVLSN